jgi:hypothetical protein
VPAVDRRGGPLALALLLVLAGCSSYVPLDPPGPSAVGPVFVVHGIWPDGEGMWADEVIARLQEEGVEALPVRHLSFVLGYLLDYGTDGPADRIAEFEREMRSRHARTSCRAPLRLSGVGFSAGTAILQKAAARGVHWETLVFGGSPLPSWSRSLLVVLREGRVGRLINYYSPIDPIVFWTCGAGIYGFHAGGALVQASVENRLGWNLHWPEFWEDDELPRLIDDLLPDDGRAARPHTCYQDATYLEWFRAARVTLRG